MNAVFKSRNVENNNVKIKKGFNLVAFADEVEPTKTVSEPQSQQPQVNFEVLIQRARSEEKEKLYPKIEKLEGEKATLIEKNNNLMLQVGEKETVISSLKAELEKTKKEMNKSESEEVKQLKAHVESLTKQLEEATANTVDVEELRNSIRTEIDSEYQVKLYKEQKLNEFGNVIIPELVSGNTKEEIDASLEVAKTRFNEITARFTTPKANMIPSVNINTSSSLNTKDVSIEDIQRMTPQQYAEYRAKIGMK